MTRAGDPIPEGLHPLEAWRLRHRVSRRALILVLREISGRDRLGPGNVFLYERRGMRPRRDIAAAIYRATDGDVRPEHFGLDAAVAPPDADDPPGRWRERAVALSGIHYRHPLER